MTELPKSKARSVGVSNFTREHVSSPSLSLSLHLVSDADNLQLETIIKATGKTPAALQIERHPLLRQDDLIAYCKEKGIHITAYSVRQPNLPDQISRSLC